MTLSMFATLFGLEWSSGWTYVLFGGLVLMIITGTWAGAVAAGKGRSMQWWFIIGFFLPVIGVILAYVLPKKANEAGPAA